MGITSKDIAAQRAMLERGEEKRLRDQFAAAVLPICNRNNRTDEQIAENAYRLADAMLHERAKRQAIAATEKAMRCEENSHRPESYDQSDEKRTDANTDGDIATRLRQTRADMIGTDDEQHYWDCHDAAVEIDRLRLELSVQKACTVAGREEIARLREAIRRLAEQDATLSVQGGSVTVTMDATLTAEERDAIETSISKRLDMDAIYTLRKLLERLT